MKKTAFRPSSISRYTNCNLWKHLPTEEKAPKQLAYLQKGTEAHKRLEEERFTEEEASCKEYFKRSNLTAFISSKSNTLKWISMESF